MKKNDVVQIVTNNTVVCKATTLLIGDEFYFIYWTSCIVHTLNLSLKKNCIVKNS